MPLAPLERRRKLPARYLIRYEPHDVGTIVVLDDDQVMVELLRTVVADPGRTTLAVADLDELPPSLRPDLVVSDLMSVRAYRSDEARAWVSALRDRFHAPIIVVTAHAAALAEPDKLGADEVIPKPFDVEALLAKIDQLLA